MDEILMISVGGAYEDKLLTKSIYFLRHFKRVAKILLLFTFLLCKNTRLCLQSIVCYTFESFSTRN